MLDVSFYMPLLSFITGLGAIGFVIHLEIRYFELGFRFAQAIEGMFSFCRNRRKLEGICICRFGKKGSLLVDMARRERVCSLHFIGVDIVISGMRYIRKARAFDGASTFDLRDTT